MFINKTKFYAHLLTHYFLVSTLSRTISNLGVQLVITSPFLCLYPFVLIPILKKVCFFILTKSSQMLEEFQLM